MRRVRRLVARAPTRLVLRAGYSTALRLAATLLALAFGIVGVRVLGADVFGTYVAYSAAAGVLTVATSAGLPTLLGREIAASRGSGDRGALGPIVQGLAAVGALLCLVLLVVVLCAEAELALVVLLALLGNAASVLGSVHVGFERVLVAVWVGNVLGPAVALVSLTLLALGNEPSPVLPLLAQVFGSAASVAALALLWRGEPLTHAVRALRRAWWSDRHGPLARAGVLVASTQVLINLTTQVDLLLLAALAGPEVVARYYAAARAALVVGFFFAASGMLAEPALTRLYAAGDLAGLRAEVRAVARSGVVVTALASVAALLLAPAYLRAYGPDFLAAMPSFAVLVGGLLVHSVFGPAQPLLRATRADLALLWQTGIAIAANAALTLALVPLLGMLGAAIASAVQFALYGMVMWRTLLARTGIRCDALPQALPSAVRRRA